jgi:hypothetical protein
VPGATANVCNHLQTISVVWRDWRMAHEVFHVVHRSVEAGGIFFVAAGAAVGVYATVPNCTTPHPFFQSAGPPIVCTNHIGFLRKTSTTQIGNTWLPPMSDAAKVPWALLGLGAGAALGGGAGYMWREFRGVED